MLQPAEPVIQHRRLEPPALAVFADRGDAGHHRQVGVDHPGAVAGRTGALGVGAEQRGLDAVGLRERVADRIEQTGVGRRIAPPRAADRRLVDRHHAVPARDRAVDQRALAGPGHAGHHNQHAERDVDVDVLQVVRAGAAHLHHTRGRAHRRLQRGPIAQVTPGERAALPQPVDGAFEDHLAAGSAGAWTEIDDVVGDRDRLGLVLDHENGIALVAQPQQQAVHPLDVVGVQPDRRFVEHVGHVGERRTEVADHLRALRLAARQRAGRPVEAQVAQTDLHERVERVPQRRQQRRDGRLAQTSHPLGQVADLHRARVGDVLPFDLRGPCRLVEPRPTALGTGGKRDRALHERPDVRLHCVDVLGQERLLDPRDKALVGEVDVLELHLSGLAVEKVLALFFVYLLIGLSGSRPAAAKMRTCQPSAV